MPTRVSELKEDCKGQGTRSQEAKSIELISWMDQWESLNPYGDNVLNYRHKMTLEGAEK